MLVRNDMIAVVLFASPGARRKKHGSLTVGPKPQRAMKERTTNNSSSQGLNLQAHVASSLQNPGGLSPPPSRNFRGSFAKISLKFSHPRAANLFSSRRKLALYNIQTMYIIYKYIYIYICVDYI